MAAGRADPSEEAATRHRTWTTSLPLLLLVPIAGGVFARPRIPEASADARRRARAR